MNEHKKEEQCPFCMSTEHHKDLLIYPRGTRPLRLALQHKSTCPRYLKCMGCGGDAITGIYGLCSACCEKEEERHKTENELNEAEDGYRELDVGALNTTVRIIPRDGGAPVEANGATVVRFLSDIMEKRGLYKLVDFIGQGEVRLAFSTTTVSLSDGFYTIERVGSEDFVPDFYRCNACGNVGADHFRYDPNPKGLPPIEAPALAVVIEDAEGEKLRLRHAGKMVGFTEDAERRARGWAGTGPRRGAVSAEGPLVFVDAANHLAQAEAAAAIPIAEIFGCARTGEDGAVYCAKCKSYDVRGVSGAEQNEEMLRACAHELLKAAPSKVRLDVAFIEELHVKLTNDGLGLLTAAEVLRLYKNYKKLEAA